MQKTVVMSNKNKTHFHNWLYNFPSIPNKRICDKCEKREKLNLRTLEWNGTFEDERTNKELINKWF